MNIYRNGEMIAGCDNGGAGVTFLRLPSGHDARLTPDEADALGDALKACAAAERLAVRTIEEARRRARGGAA